MVWKSVAWMTGLLPVLAGCGALHNLTTETHLSHTQRAIAHDLRKDARAAWKCVREQYPRQAFTAEFRDGFLDGYVDYLDRGGAAQPPAVPPLQYVRNKKYFTTEGQSLIRDYYLGFKYGTDVAVASGRRQFLTVPVLLPDTSCPPGATHPRAPGEPCLPTAPSVPRPEFIPTPGTGKFGEPKPKKKGSDDPPETPSDTQVPLPTSPSVGSGGPGKPISPLPKPEIPVIKPYNPTLPGGKFAPLPVPPNSDLLPVPDPPLPVPNSRIPPLPVPPAEPSSTLPPILEPPSAMKLGLPTPPSTVPVLPSSAATPSILDDLPVIPFEHTMPKPLPVSNPGPGK